MPSTWTTNLGLEKPATGEQAGLWGQTANKSYDFLDTSIDGNLTIPLSASGYTLQTFQGQKSEGHNKVIAFSGTLTADATITISPATAQKIYYVLNQTGGGFSLNFKQGSGPTYKLYPGRSAVIYADGGGGAGGGAAGVFGALSDFQVNSLLILNNLVVGSITATTIAGPVTINVGSDQAYDMYYRSADGSLARLASGASGTQLTSGGTAAPPAWTSPALPALPFSIGGAGPNFVFTANASGQMYQDPNLLFVAGQGLGIGMVPAHALSLGRNLAAVIQLDAVRSAPAARQLLCTSDGVARWQIGATNEVEAGTPANSTVGCNFLLLSYNNDNSVNVTNWGCYRNGRMTIGSVYNDSYDAKLTVTNAGGVASTYTQVWLNAAGTTVATVSNSGNMNITGQYQVNGAPLNTAGGLAGIQVSGDNMTPHTGPFTWLEFFAAAGMQITWGGAGGPGNNTAIINFASINCDAQLKRNVRPLIGGLPVINQLSPVHAEWNGLANTREGQPVVSVIAQDLQKVIPEAVVPFRGMLRPQDTETVELLSLESMAITSHLILAVQQLDERLKALE